MKIAKRILSMVSTGVLLCILCFGLAMQLFPEQSNRIFGYRIFTILTDSMEPVIPVGSLVVSKTLQDYQQPKSGDVISFKATRFGTEIMLTHYFSEQQMKDGVPYYRTHAYGVDEYDNYETKYSDILGIMQFHIPYLGKMMMFLASPFGMGLLVFILIVLFANYIAGKFFDLEADLNEEVHFIKTRHIYKEDIQGVLAFENIKIEDKGSYLMLEGDVMNISTHRLRKAKLNFVFRDAGGELLVSQTLHLEGLKRKDRNTWRTSIKQDPRICDLQIQVIKVKR